MARTPGRKSIIPLFIPLQPEMFRFFIDRLTTGIPPAYHRNIYAMTIVCDKVMIEPGSLVAGSYINIYMVYLTVHYIWCIEYSTRLLCLWHNRSYVLLKKLQEGRLLICFVQEPSIIKVIKKIL